MTIRRIMSPSFSWCFIRSKSTSQRKFSCWSEKFSSVLLSCVFFANSHKWSWNRARATRPLDYDLHPSHYSNAVSGDSCDTRTSFRKTRRLKLLINTQVGQSIRTKIFASVTMIRGKIPLQEISKEAVIEWHFWCAHAAHHALSGSQDLRPVLKRTEDIKNSKRDDVALVRHVHVVSISTMSWPIPRNWCSAAKVKVCWLGWGRQFSENLQWSCESCRTCCVGTFWVLSGRTRST